MSFPISIVIPTYRREGVLIETIALLLPLLKGSDEILVMDQTAEHEPETENHLLRLATEKKIRWFRTEQPGRCAGMNSAALHACGEILLFLDDDIIPFDTLLDAHRSIHQQRDAPPAVVGQVLQPWNESAIDHVSSYEIGFDAAYSKPCDVIALMGGNFSIRTAKFIALGGMDENFWGYIYRDDSELAHRIVQTTGRRIRFEPKAGIRHLMAGSGGSRAFGTKNSWGDIGGSIGDYYFAMRRLGPIQKWRHCVCRFFREPLNRYTISRPWLIPSLYLREAVGWLRAVGRIIRQPNNYIKPLEHYSFQEHSCETLNDIFNSKVGIR